MAEKEPRSTADRTALLLTVEAQKPEAERICYDPYARAMIPGGASYVLNRLAVRSGLYERNFPGASAFVIGRERYIDDFLKDQLLTGLEQVVLLGAGYDSRPYRIPGIQKAHVFEVDTPAVQALKQQRLQRIMDHLPTHVAYLPMDFHAPLIIERFQKAGFDDHRRTLFIWQGMTCFLNVEAVDRTLTFINRHSGSGSMVIFDYLYAEILKDPRRKDIQQLYREARRSGGGELFGIDRGQIEPFLVQRGFCEVHSVTLEELRRVYFTGPNSGRFIPSGMAIVSARVNQAQA
jgi:methyltransferase (TIGR00027 family)